MVVVTNFFFRIVTYIRINNPLVVGWMEADFNTSVQSIVRKGKIYADKMTGEVQNMSLESFTGRSSYDILIKKNFKNLNVHVSPTVGVGDITKILYHDMSNFISW